MLRPRNKRRTMHRSQIKTRIVNKTVICCRIAEAVCLVLLMFAGEFAAASAQTMSSESAKTPAAAQVGSQAPKRVLGYLQGSEPDFLLLLPPYPALDTEQDKIDVATFRRMQVSDRSTRWKLAEADDQMTYARFSRVLGVDLDANRQSSTGLDEPGLIGLGREKVRTYTILVNN